MAQVNRKAGLAQFGALRYVRQDAVFPTLLVVVAALNFFFNSPLAVGLAALAGALVDLNLVAMFVGAGVLVFVISVYTSTKPAMRLMSNEG